MTRFYQKIIPGTYNIGIKIKNEIKIKNIDSPITILMVLWSRPAEEREKNPICSTFTFRPIGPREEHLGEQSYWFVYLPITP